VCEVLFTTSQTDNNLVLVKRTTMKLSRATITTSHARRNFLVVPLVQAKICCVHTNLALQFSFWRNCHFLFNAFDCLFVVWKQCWTFSCCSWVAQLSISVSPRQFHVMFPSFLCSHKIEYYSIVILNFTSCCYTRKLLWKFPCVGGSQLCSLHF